ncbi:kinetochore protein mis14 [Beauveria bassiana ARSEF 2860]|uniref:Kinetochore protein mis14 n=1 Tax=Beauveria bassiana (strain ARSEF 2860) TaxID=655819 RepID=J4KNW2_BEAB2|nr:kinetochore protein mis14 [Beauveria bassiana ARSEF 2860]EJP66399.1 kinetochore protein mis14 [Beauveria bassiana ARSEF 2860]
MRVYPQKSYLIVGMESHHSIAAVYSLWLGEAGWPAGRDGPGIRLVKAMKDLLSSPPLMDDGEDGGPRRIELASHKDFAFLIANVRAAAAEHLHAAFPPQSNGGEDELRNEIEAIVDSYIDRTFTLAVPNLSINGLPANAADFFKPSRSGSRKSSIPPMPSEEASISYEPFDAEKRARVAALVSQEEALLEQVAAMKRAVPAGVAAKVAAQLDDAATRDDAQLQGALDAAATGRALDGGDALLLLLPPLERQEGVEERFRGAVDALGRLKRDMPSVVAKMERARVAGEYVRDER